MARSEGGDGVDAGTHLAPRGVAKEVVSTPRLDLVPVDMVVNAMLAALPRLARDGGLSVYQVATGARNPARMRHLHDLIVRYFQANPMFDRDGRPIHVKPLRFPPPALFRLQHRLKSTPLAWAERALEWLMDRGIAAGWAGRLRRRLAAALAALEKLHDYGELYEPYLNLDCRFLVDDGGFHGFDWALPAGRNALFAYLLPDLVVAVFDTLAGLGVDLWPVFWWSWEGATGVANALVWTALMLALTTLATRQRYVLKL